MPENVCTPAAVAAESACWCGPEDLQRAEMIYLLNQISGLNLTPAELASRAACYNCVPQDVQMAEITLLLCSIANAQSAPT